MLGGFLQVTLLPSILSGMLILVWSHKWGNKPIFPSLGESKHQARTSLIVVVVTFALVMGLTAMSPKETYSDSGRHGYTFVDVVGQAIVWGILLVPMLAGMMVNELGWRDLQYRRERVVSSVILGTVIGGIFLASGGKIGLVSGIWSGWFIWGVLQFLVVGFAEETLFRGYVQVRWVGARGWWRGWLLTSFVMSLFHVPILLGGGALIHEASIEVLKIFPLSLLLGYSLQKSGNVVLPGVIHLWLNVVERL